MDGDPKFLVDRSSATDGYWDDGAHNCLPLDKDHSHLVKFKPHDEHYPAVLAALKRMVATAINHDYYYYTLQLI
jgi:hypothetical protein